MSPPNPNPARRDRILAMWFAGKTGTQIGMALGMSREAVQGIVWRARQRGFRVPKLSNEECRRRNRVGHTEDPRLG